MNAPTFSSLLCAARNRGAPLTAAGGPPQKPLVLLSGKEGMKTWPSTDTENLPFPHRRGVKW